MNRLWRRMTEAFGQQWVKAYGETPNTAWAKSLAGIGLDRIAVAIERCEAGETNGWPPSLPQFVHLASLRPDELGAPDAETALLEAIRNSYPYRGWQKWSHKCVYWAAVRTGMGDLNERQHQMRKRFEREYLAALSEADTLDDPPIAKLPRKRTDEEIERNRAAAKQGISALREMLGGTNG